MSDEAPKRIFAKDGHDSWGAYGHWYSEAKGGGIQYVRADIHYALKAENERLRAFISDFALNKFEVETPRDGHLPPWDRGDDMTPYAMVEAWQDDAATKLKMDDDQ